MQEIEQRCVSGQEQDQVPHSRSGPRSRESSSAHVSTETRYNSGNRAEHCEDSDRRRWSRQCSEVQQLQCIETSCMMPASRQTGKSMSLPSRIGPVPQAQVVQQTVATPQTHFIDRAVHIPLETWRQCRSTRKIQNTVVVPHGAVQRDEPVVQRQSQSSRRSTRLLRTPQAQFIPIAIQKCRRPWSSHRSSALRRSSMSQLRYNTKHHPSRQYRRCWRLRRIQYFDRVVDVLW